MQPTGQTGLFKFMKTVQVTPVDNLVGGQFVRIGYVPGRDRIVATFKARLGQAQGDCTGIFALAYREYTLDMLETGKDNIINCYAGPDIGGLFSWDDYYYVAMGHDNVNNVDGWFLARYNAVTWTSLVEPFFYPLAAGELPDDPMTALVNGQIDISSHFKSANEMGPGQATHHQFFTPDLKFINKRVLSEIPHINLSSMIAINGVTNFITSTNLLGDLVVMRYDPNWNYLGMQTLKQQASAPEGVAFDGTRFYVTYVDVSSCTTIPCYENIRLAAFDSNWSLLDDIAVTDFVPGDHKAPGRPSLTLWNNRIYVCYDQNENETFTESPETADIQVYVKIYDLTQRP